MLSDDERNAVARFLSASTALADSLRLRWEQPRSHSPLREPQFWFGTVAAMVGAVTAFVSLATMSIQTQRAQIEEKQLRYDIGLLQERVESDTKAIHELESERLSLQDALGEMRENAASAAEHLAAVQGELARYQGYLEYANKLLIDSAASPSTDSLPPELAQTVRSLIQTLDALSGSDLAAEQVSRDRLQTVIEQVQAEARGDNSAVRLVRALQARKLSLDVRIAMASTAATTGDHVPAGSTVLRRSSLYDGARLPLMYSLERNGRTSGYVKPSDAADRSRLEALVGMPVLVSSKGHFDDALHLIIVESSSVHAIP